MKKVIQLTESDLTRIVKRIIRENEEQQIADEVANTLLNNMSQEELMFLGKMFNKLGNQEFKEVAQDAIEDVIENETVSESLGMSKGKLTVSTETEKDKLEVTKLITRWATIVLGGFTGALSYSFLNSPDQSQEHIEAGIVMGIVSAAMAGANLLSRIPHKVGAKPLPEKLKNSKIVRVVDSEMKKINPRGKELGEVVNHFVTLGFPEEIITKFILNWAEKNNVNFKEGEKIRPKRAK